MADRIRLGDVVLHRRSDGRHRALAQHAHALAQRTRPLANIEPWRWVVVGFYQWDGPQIVRLEHEYDRSVEYEAPEAELVHADDAVVRLGKLVSEGRR